MASRFAVYQSDCVNCGAITANPYSVPCTKAGACSSKPVAKVATFGCQNLCAACLACAIEFDQVRSGHLESSQIINQESR